MPQTYEGSHTFHPFDLYSFSSTLDSNLRSNSFKEGELDNDLRKAKKIARRNALKARSNQKFGELRPKSKPKSNHIYTLYSLSPKSLRSMR
ncbi:hypothetical protein CR513_21836, partial [Mucuna pruriens]